MSSLSVSWLAGYWDRFWFAPGSPRNLAAARIVFAAYSLWVLASRNLAQVSGLPSEFWSQVAASARWRYLDFPGHASLERVLVWIAGIALISAVVGVLPRWSCFIAAILLYHLAPFESMVWVPHPYARGLTISVIALLTLSFSPCGDCWSLLPSAKATLVLPPGDYTWPIRLIQLFLAEIYLFSGYAKIMVVGWKWASASNIRNWMLYCNEEDQIRVFHTLGFWIAERPWVCWTIGIGTLVFELGFITALFSKTARRVLVPLVALFHLAILLSMNLVFLNVPQLLVFADWDRVAAWFKLQPEAGSGEPAPGAAVTPQPQSVATTDVAR